MNHFGFQSKELVAPRTVSDSDVTYRTPPSDLIDRRQWVVWQQSGDDKLPKVPRATKWTGNGWNRPSNWVTFDVARSRADDDRADGVGYVLSETPHTGIDLDAVRNPKTGSIHHGARAMLNQFASYAEVSPSGTGVKLWVRGTWPLDGHKFDLADVADDDEWTGEKTPSIEVYDTGRYFTCTGWHVPEMPHEVSEGQEQLNALADLIGPEEDPAESEGDSTGSDTNTTSGASGRFSGPLKDRLAEARKNDETVNALCQWAELNGAAENPAYPGDRSRTVCSMAWRLAYWFEKDKGAVRQVLDHLNPPRWCDESDWWKETALKAVDAQPNTYTPAEWGDSGTSKPSRELCGSVYWTLDSRGELAMTDLVDELDYWGREQARKALRLLEARGMVGSERRGRSRVYFTDGPLDAEWIRANCNSIRVREEYLRDQNLQKFGKDSRAE